jgi:hypothetical protein
MTDPTDRISSPENEPVVEGVAFASFSPSPAAAAPDNDVIGRLVEGLPSVRLGGETLTEFLGRSVSAALERRQTPEDQRSSPRMDLFIPAVEAMRYSPNRDAIAALIASAMDRRTADAVHPAFVEILKQCSEDDLALLHAAPEVGRFLPIADVVYVTSSEQVMSAYRHVVPEHLARAVSNRANIPLCLDNLIRLNLLSRPFGQIAEPGAYKMLAQYPFVRAIMKAAPKQAKAGLEEYVIGVTDLGDGLRKACRL